MNFHDTALILYISPQSEMVLTFTSWLGSHWGISDVLWGFLELSQYSGAPLCWCPVRRFSWGDHGAAGFVEQILQKTETFYTTESSQQEFGEEPQAVKPEHDLVLQHFWAITSAFSNKLVFEKMFISLRLSSHLKKNFKIFGVFLHSGIIWAQKCQMKRLIFMNRLNLIFVYILSGWD